MKVQEQIDSYLDSLPEIYGNAIGKATLTSYCNKFKRIGEINEQVLMAAIRDGIAQTNA